MSSDAYEDFLSELIVLTRKHGIKIDGCGCCGSPFLMELKEEEKAEPYRYFVQNYDHLLRWDSENPYVSKFAKSSNDESAFVRKPLRDASPDDIIISKWTDEPVVVSRITEEETAKHATAYAEWKRKAKDWRQE